MPTSYPGGRDANDRLGAPGGRFPNDPLGADDASGTDAADDNDDCPGTTDVADCPGTNLVPDDDEACPENPRPALCTVPGTPASGVSRRSCP